MSPASVSAVSLSEVSVSEETEVVSVRETVVVLCVTEDVSEGTGTVVVLSGTEEVTGAAVTAGVVSVTVSMEAGVSAGEVSVTVLSEAVTVVVSVTGAAVPVSSGAAEDNDTPASAEGSSPS